MVKQIADDAEDATKIESVNDKFQKYMADRGGRLIYRNIRAAGDSTIYLWKDGIVDLQITGDYVSVQALSLSQTFVEEIREHFKPEWLPGKMPTRG